MGVMQKITIITAIILTVFDAFLVAVIKRSIISFKALFSTQEIRIMALIELRWQGRFGNMLFISFHPCHCINTLAKVPKP